MGHLQRLLPPWSEEEGGLRFFTAIRQKNSRHHDKREQHTGPPARSLSQAGVSALFLAGRVDGDAPEPRSAMDGRGHLWVWTMAPRIQPGLPPRSASRTISPIPSHGLKSVRHVLFLESHPFAGRR